MASDDELQNALLAIHSRLGAVEGRVTLIARAERPELLSALEDVVKKSPLVGQIYLVLDGSLNQNEVYNVLESTDIDTSAMSVSRALGKMYTEHGIVELVSGGGAKVFRKGNDSEVVLNLSANVRKWLGEIDAVDPAPPPKRKRRK